MCVCVSLLTRERAAHSRDSLCCSAHELHKAARTRRRFSTAEQIKPGRGTEKQPAVSSAISILHLQSSVFLLISGPSEDVIITVWILILIWCESIFNPIVQQSHSWKSCLCSSPAQDTAVVPSARELKDRVCLMSSFLEAMEDSWLIVTMVSSRTPQAVLTTGQLSADTGTWGCSSSSAGQCPCVQRGKHKYFTALP